MSYLLDTNDLLRVVQVGAPEHPLAVNAIVALEDQEEVLCVTSQNLVEFWSAATRPREVNGLGLPAERTAEVLREVQHRFTLLPDAPAIFQEWLNIVAAIGVLGRQVHDARLAAVMHVYEVTHILTFNDQDFRRYPGITVVHPREIPPPPDDEDNPPGEMDGPEPEGQ